MYSCPGPPHFRNRFAVSFNYKVNMLQPTPSRFSFFSLFPLSVLIFQLGSYISYSFIQLFIFLKSLTVRSYFSQTLTVARLNN